MNMLIYKNEHSRMPIVVNDSFDSNDGDCLVMSLQLYGKSEPSPKTFLKKISFYDKSGKLDAEFIPIIREKDNEKGFYNAETGVFSFNDSPGDFLNYWKKCKNYFIN